MIKEICDRCGEQSDDAMIYDSISRFLLTEVQLCKTCEEYVIKDLMKTIKQKRKELLPYLDV